MRLTLKLLAVAIAFQSAPVQAQVQVIKHSIQPLQNGKLIHIETSDTRTKKKAKLIYFNGLTDLTLYNKKGEAHFRKISKSKSTFEFYDFLQNFPKKMRLIHRDKKTLTKTIIETNFNKNDHSYKPYKMYQENLERLFSQDHGEISQDHGKNRGRGAFEEAQENPAQCFTPPENISSDITKLESDLTSIFPSLDLSTIIPPPHFKPVISSSCFTSEFTEFQFREAILFLQKEALAGYEKETVLACRFKGASLELNTELIAKINQLYIGDIPILCDNGNDFEKPGEFVVPDDKNPNGTIKINPILLKKRTPSNFSTETELTSILLHELTHAAGIEDENKLLEMERCCPLNLAATSTTMSTPAATPDSVISCGNLHDDKSKTGNNLPHKNTTVESSPSVFPPPPFPEDYEEIANKPVIVPNQQEPNPQEPKNTPIAVPTEETEGIEASTKPASTLANYLATTGNWLETSEARYNLLISPKESEAAATYEKRTPPERRKNPQPRIDDREKRKPLSRKPLLLSSKPIKKPSQPNPIVEQQITKYPLPQNDPLPLREDTPSTALSILPLKEGSKPAVALPGNQYKNEIKKEETLPSSENAPAHTPEKSNASGNARKKNSYPGNHVNPPSPPPQERRSQTHHPFVLVPVGGSSRSSSSTQGKNSDPSIIYFVEGDKFYNDHIPKIEKGDIKHLEELKEQGKQIRYKGKEYGAGADGAALPEIIWEYLPYEGKR